MKQGTACPCGWQHAAASSRATQALQLREAACLLDLHRGFIHHASRTTQPPRGGATAASACVAARAEDELNRIVPAGRSACVGGGRLIRLLVVGCLKCVAERGCGAGLGIECAAVLMF